MADSTRSAGRREMMRIACLPGLEHAGGDCLHRLEAKYSTGVPVAGSRYYLFKMRASHELPSPADLE